MQDIKFLVEPKGVRIKGIKGDLEIGINCAYRHLGASSAVYIYEEWEVLLSS